MLRSPMNRASLGSFLLFLFAIFFSSCTLLHKQQGTKVDKNSPDWLYQSLASSDFQEMVTFLERGFLNHQLSKSESLYWEEAPFDNLINYYNPFSEKIFMSVFPSEQEVWAYWENWSSSLTDERWDFKTFFRDIEEAQLLANYNILVLSAHELGHYFAFRYQWEPKVLNCQEYVADLLAVSLINEWNSHPKFVALQNRYHELINQINENIAPASRFSLESWETLDSQCEQLDVEQPSDISLLPQYASAFFARHHVLYESTSVPTLESIKENNLWVKYIAYLNKYPASNKSNAVIFSDTVLTEIESLEDRSFMEGISLFFPDPSDDNGIYSNFSLDGVLNHFQIENQPLASGYFQPEFYFWTENDSERTHIELPFFEADSSYYFIKDAITLSDSSILALISRAIFIESSHQWVYLLRFQPNSVGTWTTTSKELWKKLEKTDSPLPPKPSFLSVTPENDLFVIGYEDYDEPYHLSISTLSIEDFEVKSEEQIEVQYPGFLPFGMDTNKNIFAIEGFDYSETDIIQYGSDGWKRILGNGLQGLKLNENLQEIELYEITLARQYGNKIWFLTPIGNDSYLKGTLILEQ